MQVLRLIVPGLFTVLLGVQCSVKDRDILLMVNSSIEHTQQKLAPDPRISIFDLSPIVLNGRVVLTGKTSVAEAKSYLIDQLAQSGLEVLDSIRVLPDPAFGQKTRGIVNVSVANMRAKPSHRAELITQALLGTPVTLYEQSGGWYRIQTPEGYIGWADPGSFVPLSQHTWDSVQVLPAIIYLETFGFAYEHPDKHAATVSDLVAGCILRVQKQEGQFYQVIYPDKRTGYVFTKEALKLPEWQNQIERNPGALVLTARTMMGVPYLWGGTSPKGLDCSGFTKMTYFLHGIVLPRDADQQATSGVLVDSVGKFDALQPGDLLFFGSRKNLHSEARIVHVGMWLGDNNYIHASGDVHVSSMDASSEKFDAYNRGRYLKAVRVLGSESPTVIDLKEQMIF